MLQYKNALSTSIAEAYIKEIYEKKKNIYNIKIEYLDTRNYQ